MNTYGRRAMELWKLHAPQTFASLSTPNQHFSDLGAQIETMICELEEQLLLQHPVTTNDYLRALGERGAIRNQAIETVMTTMVYDPLGATPELQHEPGAQTSEPSSPWMDEQGMPTDPNHPLWSAMEDDEVSLEDFHRSHEAWIAEMTKKDPSSH